MKNYIIYDPRCEQEKLFEMGLELSRENKKKRGKNDKKNT